MSGDALAPRYTSWCVYRRLAASRPGRSRFVRLAACTDELAALSQNWAGRDTRLRGVYDLRGFRGGADLMAWWHAPTASDIQQAVIEFSRTRLGGMFTMTWSAMGMHRPAEFNREHAPAFMTNAPVQDWLCVYPFVRSYEWYLLPAAERAGMLAEHGRAGSAFRSVVTNTVASFGLSDYEWLLALEAADPVDLIDMMRALRYTEARRHVRLEVPFYTGHRFALDQLAERYV